MVRTKKIPDWKTCSYDDYCSYLHKFGHSVWLDLDADQAHTLLLILIRRDQERVEAMNRRINPIKEEPDQ